MLNARAIVDQFLEEAHIHTFQTKGKNTLATIIRLSPIGIVGDIVRDIYNDYETIKLERKQKNNREIYIVSAIYQSDNSKNKHSSIYNKNEVSNVFNNTNKPIDFDQLKLTFDKTPKKIEFDNRPFVIVTGAHWIKEKHSSKLEGNTLVTSIDYQGDELHQEENRIIAEYEMLKSKDKSLKIIETNIKRLQW